MGNVFTYYAATKLANYTGTVDKPVVIIRCVDNFFEWYKNGEWVSESDLPYMVISGHIEFQEVPEDHVQYLILNS